MAKKIIGWLLFAWGIVGLGGNILIWLPSGERIIAMMVNSAVCVALIIIGWKLSHKKPPEVIADRLD